MSELFEAGLRIIKKGSEEPIERDEHGLLVLQELTSYIIEGPGLTEIPGLLTRLTADVWELNFGNYVGKASLLGHDLTIKSKKISSRQFETLLSEISAEIANLPFDFNKPISFSFSRTATVGSDTLYQAFAYLRQIVRFDRPGLLGQFKAVEANPHRTIQKIAINEDMSRAKGIKPIAVLDAATRAMNMAKVGPGHSAFNYPVARTWRNSPTTKLIPFRIIDERVEATHDNPENRLVKAFLKQSKLILDRFTELLAARNSERNVIDTSCDLMDEAEYVGNEVERMLQAAFLDGVGEMSHVPSSSQILQRSEGYRDIFGHYHRLALISEFPIDDNALRHIMEGKDIATLYEYWCFFKIVAILRERLGEPTTALATQADEFKPWLGQGISLSFKDGTRVTFNKRYGTEGESYSVPLRPDITLETNGKLHLFDAKFKYDRISFADGASDDESAINTMEQEEEVYGRFKLGDLYKMHTYRDAIKGANDVWILYPGTEFRFYEMGRGRVNDIEAVKHFDGVGAVPVQLDRGHEELAGLIHRLLNDEGGEPCE